MLQEHSIKAVAKHTVWKFKLPTQDREDFTQDLFLKVLEHDIDSEALLYTVAHNLAIDYWERIKTSNVVSIETLEELAERHDRQDAVSNKLIGKLADVTYFLDKVESIDILDRMPKQVRNAAQNKLQGKRLTNVEKIRLATYALANGI